MLEFYSEYINQIDDALNKTSSLGRLSDWLCKNTTHAGIPYSYKGHEYQRDIVDSKHNNSVVIKPSQVGMTEATVRLILGFLCAEQGTVGLWLLPTVGESQKAAKSRIDPVIRGSKYMKSIMLSGSDSSSFKQLGDSQLFTGGTYGKAVISIPTDFLSVDEIDFCNQENVSTAESRLTHSRFINEETGDRGIKRKWSTPTAVGVGVDALYTQSDQRKRLVKCKSCGEYSWPNFLDNVVVQGWDNAMSELTYLDALMLMERGLLQTARLLCPSCHAEITRDNLQPNYRQWVAEYPSRTFVEGWHVSPFDLPDYHTPESILRKLISYQTNINHFRNFVLGLPYSDATNSVVDAKVAEYTTVRPITPEQAEAGMVSGCVAGLDVGMTSWLVIGKPDYSGRRMDIVWVEHIRLQAGLEEDYLKTVVIKRLSQYKVVKLVCDSLPYTPSILSIQASRPEGWVLPNFYTLNDKKLPLMTVDEKDYIVRSNRTKTLNLTAKKINSGHFCWPMMEETKTVRKHLQGMKRIDRVLDDGEEESNWVKSGDDHYFHAANYCSMAEDLVVQEFGAVAGIPTPSIKEVIVGSNAVEVD